MRAGGRYIIILWICSMTFMLNGQVHTIPIPGNMDGLSWIEFMTVMERDYPIRFFFDPDRFPNVTVSVDQDSVPLLQCLDEIFESFGILVSADSSGNIFLLENTTIEGTISRDFFMVDGSGPEKTAEMTMSVPDSAMGDYLNTFKEFIIQSMVIGSRLKGYGQSKATVKGYVIHSTDQKPVVQANVFIEETRSLAVTNDSGFYALTLPKGKYTLSVSSLGSYEKKYKLTLLSDGRLNITLDPRVYDLGQVEITSDRYDHIKGSQMGYERLTTRNIKEIPSVLGEKDLIRVALLLPGIQTVGEATSGFNVRGSPVDQNLFYINQVPVYNTSHVFGFFSSFNPEAVSDFVIYKSHIPVQYGGRLASIFSVSARQGNMNKFSFRGGISPVAASLLVEGPFKKNESSYMLAARSTYSDWVLRLIREPDIYNSSAFFTDLMGNASWRLDGRNRIDLFTYGSMDDARITDLARYHYGNAGASLTWNNIFKEKHSAGVSLIYNRYGLDEENTEYMLEAYERNFVIHHSEFRTYLSLKLGIKHMVDAGLQSILYHAYLGDLLPLNEKSMIIPKSYEPERGIETAIYIGDEWRMSPKLSLRGGLRYTVYTYLGPKTVYTYINGLPREPVNISDTLDYGAGEVIRTYNGIDLRIGATYLINDRISVKASYNRLHQYLFLLSNTIAVAPTDTWKLCDYHIRPMVGDQYSIGLFSTMLGDMFEMSVEGYYKNVRNLVEYRDGADLVDMELTEGVIVQGDLDAYGVEWMIKKNMGAFTGWINYTYSRAMVQVNNPETGEINNFGEAYPANFDKPHAFNLVTTCRVNKRLSFSANVVYSTGRPVTYPTAIYYLNGTQFTHYSKRNEYRLPDYFRIDLSMNIEGNLKAKKMIHGSFSFSIYNLTGRNNAYSVYFTSEYGKIKAYRLSIFGAPIFSIGYNFKLGNYES